MKYSWLLVFFCSSVLMLGCYESDSSNNDNNLQGAVCTSNVCKDLKTLLFCDRGIYREIPCNNGLSCQVNQCVSGSGNLSNVCVTNTCKNENTLLFCNGGVYQEMPCGTGRKCSVNQCVTDSGLPSGTCSANQCKNNEILLVCNGGTYQEMPCGTGRKCSLNQCVTDSGQPSGTCSVNQCKNNEILLVCEGGSYREEPCGTGNKCSGTACVPDNTQSEQTCQSNVCKNESTLKVCSGGVFVEHLCGTDEKCIENDCVSTVDKCTYHECTDELSETYHACVDGSISSGLNRCESGKSCLYGSCVDTFEEGTTCSGEAGSGYCTVDKYHAVVCNDRHKLAIWTCADECIENNGFVDCPKKARPKPHECEKDYQAECINGNNQVRLCKDYQIVTWDCYGGTCSVDSNNAIYCPKNAGVAGLGGIESGGTYGDMCNIKKYQEACIDRYYARICDKDGFVRIKPAGDCKISSSNPLKVEYTVGAACDTSNYMPVCINDGKAIGFCAYDGADLTVGIYKAAHCPSCHSSSDAEACMYL